MPKGVHSAGFRRRVARRPIADMPLRAVLVGAILALALNACGSEDGQLGPEGNFSLISAGDEHSCAVMEGGQEVWCWGANEDGQLGDGSTVSSQVPRKVFVPGVVTALALGGRHSCALVDNGTVFCWGRNAEGQLGDGGVQSRSMASPVFGMNGAQAIAAGYRHTCAVERGGRVLCWGSNDKGQLGVGDGAGPDICGTNPPMPCSLSPAPVLGLMNGARVAAGGDEEGSHSCALDDLGLVHCWGDNDEMQLGDGTQVSRNRPLLVTDLSGIGDLATGGAHTCVVLADLTAWCWGRRYGSLFPITLLEGVVAVSSGRDFDCVRLEEGAMHCWGDNDDGQLGDGSRVDRVIPAQVGGLVVSASAHGGGHSCAIDDVFQVWCWGRNTDGQLGPTPLLYSSVPVPLLGPQPD